MLKNIPGKIAFYLVRKDLEDQVLSEKKNNYLIDIHSLITGKILYQIYPVPLNQANTGRTKYLSNPLGVNFQEQLELITMDNKDLKVRISTGKHNYRAYCPRICLEIIHPDLEDRKFQPYIDISYQSFLNLLSNFKVNIIDSELTDRFRLDIFNLGTYPNYSLITEDSIEEDAIISLSTKYGLLRQEKNFTSKWIPGHIYCLRNRSLFVYLGPGKKDRNMSDNRYTHYSTDMYSLFDNSNITQFWSLKNNPNNDSDVSIILPISSTKQANSVMPLKGKTLSIREIISSLALVNDSIFSDTYFNAGFAFFKKGVSKQPVRAMDLGKFIELKDIIDPENIFPEIIAQSTNYILNEKNVYRDADIKDLYVFNKDVVTEVVNSDGRYRDILINSFITNVNYSLRIVKAKLSNKSSTVQITGKDVVEFILKSKEGSYFGPDFGLFEITSVLESREKFNKFIETCPIEDFNIEELYEIVNDVVCKL